MSGAHEPALQIAGSAQAQIGLVFVVVNLAILPLVWLGVRRLVPGRNVVFARWGFSHVLLAIGAAVAAGSLLQLAVPGARESLLGQLGLSLATQLAAVVLVVGVALRRDPDGLGALGLRAGGNLRAIGAGLLLYVTCLPGIVGLGLVWVWFLTWSGAGFHPQDVALEFIAVPAGERLLPVLLGVAVIPLCEELLFRAFLQPLLVQNLREVAGVGVTALLFGALHGSSALVPICALSLVLGAVMLRTQRLAAVWAVHALHNGLMFTLLIAFPELARMGGQP